LIQKQKKARSLGLAFFLFSFISINRKERRAVKKSIIAIALSSLFLALIGCSAKEKVTELKTQDQKISYMIGQDMGSYLKKMDINVDKAALFQGIEDTLSGSKPLLTPEQVASLKQEFGKKMQDEQMAKAKVAGEKNTKDGDAFLAKNKTEKGVITTASGLQYMILTQGTGPKPKSTDMVSVNYRGTTIDGKEFDSSYKRGQPASFPVTGVIPGWTEALQLMNVGTKAKLFVPASLAYGPRGAGPDIGPNATLIFEIELLSVNPNPAATTPPPAAPAHK
jgi:FKBP-type peptidyl-prolyl cis-trans isomerase